MTAGDEVDDPELLGLRGRTRYGPRWRPVGLRLNECIRLNSEGDLAGADAILVEIVSEARVDDTDDEALDVLARALANRASVAEGRGDLTAALRHAEESLAVCERIMQETDDRFGIVDARTGVLVNRAQTLQALGRPEDALRDLDIAAEGVPASAYVRFALHNTRGATLMALERYSEAEVEIRLALDIALESEPRFVAQAYANLGTIAARTGDEQSAAAHLHLARDLHELSGNVTERAHADLNLGRAAARTGSLAEAEERLALAQRGYERAGRVLDVAGCRMSRAVIALRQERPRDAANLLDEAIAVLEQAGEMPTLVECYLTRAHATAGLAAVLAVDAAHETVDPVAGLGAWQRKQVDRWDETGDPACSPVLWAAFSTAYAPAPPSDGAGD
jgi:tetratricopeptide (TPR) repeat protein